MIDRSEAADKELQIRHTGSYALGPSGLLDRHDLRYRRHSEPQLFSSLRVPHQHANRLTVKYPVPNIIEHGRNALG